MQYYRWHTVQPEREIHRTPVPIVYNDNDVLYKVKPEHKNRLHSFIRHLKTQRFVPDYTLQELKKRYILTYGSEPSEDDGMVALFVKTATWRELFGCSYGFDGWQDKPTTNDALVDCRGRPFSVFNDMHHGDYAIGARDPVNNWGLIQQTSKYDSSIVVREVWVCCGLPREHPGCWIGTKQYKIEPYNLCPGFGDAVWEHVANGDREKIEELWNVSPHRGTMWKDVPKYEEIHKKIVLRKNALAGSVTNALIALSEEDGWIGLTLKDDIEDDLQHLVDLQNKYNQIQCQESPTTIDTLFNTEKAKQVMLDDQLRLFYKGFRLLGKKNTPRELQNDLERVLKDLSVQEDFKQYKALLALLGDELIYQCKQYITDYDTHLKDKDFLGMTEIDTMNQFYGKCVDIVNLYSEVWEYAQNYRHKVNRVVRGKTIDKEDIDKLDEEYNRMKTKTDSLDPYYKTGVVNVFKMMDAWKQVAYIKTIEENYGRFTEGLEDQYTRLEYHDRVLKLYKQYKFYSLANIQMTKQFQERHDKEKAILTAHYLANPDNYIVDGRIIKNYYDTTQDQEAQKIKVSYKQFEAVDKTNVKEKTLIKQIQRQLMFIASLSPPYVGDEASSIAGNLEEDVIRLEYVVKKMDLFKQQKHTKEDHMDHLGWKDNANYGKLTDKQKEKIDQYLFLQEYLINTIFETQYSRDLVQEDIATLSNEIESFKELVLEEDEDKLLAFIDDKEAFDYLVERHVKSGEKYLFEHNRFWRTNFPGDYQRAQKDYVEHLVAPSYAGSADDKLKELQAEHDNFVKLQKIKFREVLEWLDSFLDLSTSNAFYINSGYRLDYIEKNSDIILEPQWKEFLSNQGFFDENGRLPPKFTRREAFGDLALDEDPNWPTKVGFFIQDANGPGVYVGQLIHYMEMMCGEMSLEQFLQPFLANENLFKSFYDKNPKVIKIEMSRKKVADTNSRINELKDGADKESLVANNLKIWEERSCWMDSSFTTLFSIPNNTLIRTIVGTTAISTDVYRLSFENTPNTIDIEKTKCTPDNARQIHAAIVEDILDIQSRQEKKVCLSRRFWQEAYGCLLTPTTAAEYGKYGDPAKAIGSLVNLYNLHPDVMTFTQIAGTVVDPEAHMTRKRTSGDATPILVLNIDKPPGQGVPYRTYQQLDVRSKTQSYQIAAIITLTATQDHFTSYVYDFMKNNWAYVDISPGEKNPAFTRNIADAGIHMSALGAFPVVFVYYSSGEIADIKALKAGKLLGLPQLFDPYVNNPNFKQKFEDPDLKLQYPNDEERGLFILSDDAIIEPDAAQRAFFKGLLDAK